MVAIHHDRPISEARQTARAADRQLLQFALVMAVVGTIVMLLFTLSVWPVLLVWGVCLVATLIGMVGNHLRSGSSPTG